LKKIKSDEAFKEAIETAKIQNHAAKDGSGFVKQCLLIEPDVTGKESEYLIKTKIRLSVLME
jgi:ribonuclease III